MTDSTSADIKAIQAELKALKREVKASRGRSGVQCRSKSLRHDRPRHILDGHNGRDEEDALKAKMPAH
ncbi:hypothetical protein RI103_22440 [Paraburkholderia sp. FT54]|uniref:hypothetical protein n=1 Tax=Paraburkholderia sp. FT54 TaxID=3074437 RepID=UPI002877DB6A|nr:hypothetical protein [Paraburkholderia sp. FT54]WNC93556.1 hypothetical protein RI103_22440 [Paraburkholderia sp. FT54]